MDETTDSPQLILDRAMRRFNSLAPDKYMDGQQRHGGLLNQKKDLIWELEQEVIDSVFYLSALREQLEKREAKHEAEVAQLKATIEVMRNDA